MLAGLTRWGLCWQVLPPLLLVWLAREDWGPGFIFISGVHWFVALYSGIHLGVLLVRRKQPRGLLIRPALALSFSIIALGYFMHSLTLAQAVLDGTGRKIHALCNDRGECPSQLKGWSGTGNTQKFEIRTAGVRWPLRYTPQGKTFVLHLYKSLDFMDCVEGGVGVDYRIRCDFNE